MTARSMFDPVVVGWFLDRTVTLELKVRGTRASRLDQQP
jgi:hypothetical protein